MKTNTDKIFDWFSDNFLKANPDKCHLPINPDENATLEVKNEIITNSSNQKLPGILFNNKFDFDEHVTSLCRKASQKLNIHERTLKIVFKDYESIFQQLLKQNKSVLYMKETYKYLLLRFSRQRMV